MVYVSAENDWEASDLDSLAEVVMQHESMLSELEIRLGVGELFAKVEKFCFLRKEKEVTLDVRRFSCNM